MTANITAYPVDVLTLVIRPERVNESPHRTPHCGPAKLCSSGEGRFRTTLCPALGICQANSVLPDGAF